MERIIDILLVRVSDFPKNSTPCIMVSKSPRLISLLVVVGLLTGCVTSAGYHDVDFGGKIGVDDGQFVMNGEVNVGIGAAPDYDFNNVTVVLLTDEEKTIRTIQVGDLSTDQDRGNITHHINITSEEIPEFVLIKSADFWTEQTDVQVAAYRRPTDSGDSYVRYDEYVRYSPAQITPQEE